MNKYKVGDEVVLMARVTLTDNVDNLPYRVKIEDVSTLFWVSEKTIAGLANDFERVKPEPKFKVGDKVINRDFPEWGVAEVKSIENVYEGKPTYGIVYYLKTSNKYITKESVLTPAGIP